MSAAPGSAREAAERNAEAILSGNLAQLMADITPEALTQLMQMATTAGANAGGLSLANLPGIRGYELTDMGEEGDLHVFHATFHSEAGDATLAAKWKQVLGQWKIAEITVIRANPAEPAGE